MEDYGTDQTIQVGERVSYRDEQAGTVLSRISYAVYNRQKIANEFGSGPPATFDGPGPYVFKVRFDNGKVEDVMSGLQRLRTKCPECNELVLVDSISDTDYICDSCRAKS